MYHLSVTYLHYEQALARVPVYLHTKTDWIFKAWNAVTRKNTFCFKTSCKELTQVTDQSVSLEDKLLITLPVPQLSRKAKMILRLEGM